MELQVNRWGNSLALRLPASLAKKLDLHEGSSLSSHELGQKLLAISTTASKQQLLAREAVIAQIHELHKNMPMTKPISKDEMSRY
jgi:antitoxin MazE